MHKPSKLDKHGCFGDIFLSPDNKFYWVVIPRNASSWISALLRSLNWKRTNIYSISNEIKQHATPLVIIRNPIDRWLSGMTYLAAAVVPEVRGQPLSEDIMKMMLHYVTFDDHSEMQSKFLDDTTQILRKPVYFSFGNNLTTEVTNFLKENGFTILTLHNADPARDHIIKSKVRKALHNKLADPKILARIQEFFEYDYEVIAREQLDLPYNIPGDK